MSKIYTVFVVTATQAGCTPVALSKVFEGAVHLAPGTSVVLASDLVGGARVDISAVTLNASFLAFSGVLRYDFDLVAPDRDRHDANGARLVLAGFSSS